MQIDAVVVGAGLFGQISAKMLRRIGMKTVIVDSQEPYSGSKPAACLMKPSWFSSLGRKVYDPALEALEVLYGLREVSFKVGPVSTKVLWIPPKSILDEFSYRLKVTRVGHGFVETERERFDCKTVVVAAGVWTGELLPVNVAPRAGLALRWPARTTTPSISPWAPYRQLVKFNRGDGVWCGDGTALKQMSMERATVSANRCGHYAGLNPSDAEWMIGNRPYCEKVSDAPCLMKEFDPGVWAVTGGAKNGTIAAGWVASKLEERYG